MSAAANNRAGASSRNNRTRRNRGPYVVENTANSHLRHFNASGREVPIGKPFGAQFYNPPMPSVVEVANLPAAAPAPGFQLPRAVMPAVVEVAPRGPVVTPGYGHLDYARTNLGAKKLSEVGWRYAMTSPGGTIVREYASFDESGRYIVAKYHRYSTQGMGGFGKQAHYILIDNHGQKHEYTEVSATFKPYLVLNNEYYPRQLPDVVIDQIKLFADLTDDLMIKMDQSFSASNYIENLRVV